MKKTISIILAITVLACLTACKTESYSTVKTDVSVSTTKDGETTENNLSSEVTVGAAAGETDEIETEGSKYDSDVYDWNYFVNDSDNLVLYGPETDSDWWRNLSFGEETDTMVYVADELDDKGIYYVEVTPVIQNGEGRAILGHFTSENSEKAVDFAVIDVEVEDGKVVSITNSGFIADLNDL